MQIHDFGDWIEVTYWNDKVEYVKTLPEDLSEIYCVKHLFDGLAHKEDDPAIVYYFKLL